MRGISRDWIICDAGKAGYDMVETSFNLHFFKLSCMYFFVCFFCVERGLDRERERERECVWGDKY